MSDYWPAQCSQKFHVASFTRSSTLWARTSDLTGDGAVDVPCDKQFGINTQNLTMPDYLTHWNVRWVMCDNKQQSCIVYVLSTKLRGKITMQFLP